MLEIDRLGTLLTELSDIIHRMKVETGEPEVERLRKENERLRGKLDNIIFCPPHHKCRDFKWCKECRDKWLSK